MNDPVAVLLVLGFIEWIKRPDYGVLGHGPAVRAAARHRRGRRRRRRLAGGAGLPPRAKLATGGLYPVASLAVVAIAFGARRRAARLRASSRSTSPAWRWARRRCPRARPWPRSTTAWRGSRSWRCSSRSACSSSPAELGRVRAAGHGRRARARVRRAAAGGDRRDGVRAAVASTDRLVLGWAGLRGAVPVVLALFPIIERVPGSRDVLQHRVLRGARLDAAAGLDVRAARAEAGRDDRASPRCAAARRGRLDPPARRRRRRGPDRRGRRRDRRARARPRAAARRARQRARARRRGAAAARLDAPGGRRPAVHRRAPGRDGARSRRRASAGAPVPSARRRGPTARRTPTGAPIFTTRPWTEADGDPDAPDERARPRGHRAARHALGRARRARRARRRPLRGDRARTCSSARREQVQWHARRRLRDGARRTPSGRGGRRSSARRRCSACGRVEEGWTEPALRVDLQTCSVAAHHRRPRRLVVRGVTSAGVGSGWCGRRRAADAAPRRRRPRAARSRRAAATRLVVDLQRRVADPEALAQQRLQLAPAPVAVVVGRDDDVRGERREARRDLPDVQVVDLDDALAARRARGRPRRGRCPRGAASSSTRADACSSDQPERSISAATVSAASASTCAGPPDGDHDAGGDRRDRAVEVGEHVRARARDVQALALGARQRPERGDVDERADDADDDRRSARRRPAASRAAARPRRRSRRRARTARRR